MKSRSYPNSLPRSNKWDNCFRLTSITGEGFGHRWVVGMSTGEGSKRWGIENRLADVGCAHAALAAASPGRAVRAAWRRTNQRRSSSAPHTMNGNGSVSASASGGSGAVASSDCSGGR